ncbi:hypothetical protein GXN76_04510 [Kroppenstedtia pulmonis]|uniref:DUF4198 domain-containing protein n=1 Tax=Kroppenstedtia pulmonis TaxID=1380685 RepID=A0A7D4BIR0_9BACL|nr:hypothetical protein [Kroppenstedtia pulmonis]QKG83810.1 hypothetical protein GXN76_04510 [Kroppenstedtia pulmonis]
MHTLKFCRISVILVLLWFSFSPTTEASPDYDIQFKMWPADVEAGILWEVKIPKAKKARGTWTFIFTAPEDPSFVEKNVQKNQGAQTTVAFYEINHGAKPFSLKATFDGVIDGETVHLQKTHTDFPSGLIKHTACTPKGLQVDVRLEQGDRSESSWMMELEKETKNEPITLFSFEKDNRETSVSHTFTEKDLKGQHLDPGKYQFSVWYYGFVNGHDVDVGMLETKDIKLTQSCVDSILNSSQPPLWKNPSLLFVTGGVVLLCGAGWYGWKLRK